MTFHLLLAFIFCAAGLVCIYFGMAYAWALISGNWPGDPERYRGQSIATSFLDGISLPWLEGWLRLTYHKPWFDPQTLENIAPDVRALAEAVLSTQNISPDLKIRVIFGLRETRTGRDPEPFLEFRHPAGLLGWLPQHTPPMHGPEGAQQAFVELLGDTDLRLSPVWNRNHTLPQTVSREIVVQLSALSAHERISAIQYADALKLPATQQATVP